MPEASGGDESWKPVLHPDDLQPCIDRWYTCVRTGEVYQLDIGTRTREPARIGGTSDEHCRRNNMGDIVRWFGTSTDIEAIKAENNCGAPTIN